MRTLTTLAIAAWMFVHFVSEDLLAQTPGLIVKPAVAGKSVLDPNLDNYTSSDNEGFVSNDEGESEIPFVPIVLVSPEPTSDLATGPSCGFTDLVDDATSYSAAYTYISGSNWLFRFRLGNYATNSKGYSILLDTDGLFGNSGTLKDPNYTTGNPGFEIEIILVTNHGVRLYDADGTASPTLRTTLSHDDYSQKSVAFTTNCSNPDYFYDFYIPIATITTYFPSFSASTTVRMVANTVISTQSVLQGGPSDIGGINDGTYAGNYSNAWTAVVNASVPTAPSNFNSGFPAVRSATPVVNSPLSVGATSVSGTSTEANGTVINVYVNGVSVGATTVTGGTWTLSGIAALTLSASVKATATATGKSVSYDSNAVTVGATCSLAPPAASCQSNKGIGGSGPTGAAAGTTIAFYGPNVPGTFFTSVTTNASNTFLYNCAGGTTNCTGGGPNCITSGIYWITAQESGKCQSPKTTTVCIGTSGTATTPVITTNPILATTTTITGTATAGNTVLLHINGYLQASTTATGGNWTFSGLTLTLGQSVSVYTVQTGQCISSAATRSVTETSTAPVVKSPIVTGATSVSGTSVEAAGTTITLYKTGVSAGTTTVDANGNWTITGLSPALAGGNLIKATATASGESVSGFSNEVTVQSRTTAPVITGTYLEGALAVGGTSSALTGSTITLYIDGVALGTGVVAAGLWTIVTLVTDLYPGGVLTATATETGNAESLPSTSVTVTCALPSGSLGINILTGTTCVNTKASLQVLLSESNVIYTLRNFANTSDAGSSTLGTGGTVTLQSFRITATQTFIIKAVKIPNTACNSSLSTMATVTVTPPSNTTGVLSGDYFWTGSSSNNYWTDDANWVKWNGTAFETVGVSPTTTDNVVIKPMETCITNQPIIITSATATTPAVAKNITIASGATLSLENTPSERAITLTGNWSNSGTLVPNRGTIKFNGGTTQTIYSASGSETFSSIIIEGNNTVVQPLVDVSLNTNGVLNLNGGALNLNGRKVTALNPSASAIVRTSPGCVISESQNANGELRWAIGNTTATNYVFPMGNASKVYIPVTVNLASGNAGTLGVNTLFATQSSPAAWPTGSEAVTSVATPAQALRRYWHFSSTQAAGTYTATVTFSFANTEDPTAGISDITTNGIKMQRWNGTNAWNAALSGQSFSNTSPTRTVVVPDITQFSWWSGGNNGQSPLPIELLYFKGYNDHDENVLEWATATETNNYFFSVDRSKDGINFYALDSIPAAGNSTTRKDYTFRDRRPLPGLNYYRLKQIDFDLKYTHSNIVPIFSDRDASFNCILFPNPTRGELPILYITADRKQNVSIHIYDSFGVLRYTALVEVSENKTDYPLTGSHFKELPQGIYILQVSNGENTVKQSIVIN